MRSIALIGFMGTGKSAVGAELARRLGLKFVETDAIIEKAANKGISRIFAEEGEGTFRCLERSVIQAVTLDEDQVISCGGGATIDRRNAPAQDGVQSGAAQSRPQIVYGGSRRAVLGHLCQRGRPRMSPPHR